MGSKAKWKVLISVPYMQPVIEEYRPVLESHGIEIVVPKVRERLEEEELLPIIEDIDGIICGDDRITERVLDAAKRLKVISKWGTGIDSIDREAAAQQGIAVRNTPNAFTEPVADQVMAFMLSFARQIPWIDAEMKAGRWEKRLSVSLFEKTLGVVGVGNIGKAVVRRARAFGMRVLGRTQTTQGTGASVPAGVYGDARSSSGDVGFSGVAHGVQGETWSMNANSVGVKGTLKVADTVNDNAQGIAVFGEVTGNASTGTAFHGKVINSNAKLMRLFRGTSELFTVLGNGNVGISKTNPGFTLELGVGNAAKPGGGLWQSSSDRRLKKDVRPFTDGLAVIEKINPVWYQYNGKGGMPKDYESVGVVADEVRPIIPYTCRKYKAKLNPADAEETELDYFDGSPLIFILINTVKELSKRVETLERRLGRIAKK